MEHIFGSESFCPYEGVNKVKNFEVTLTEDSTTPVQHWKVENDTPFRAYLKLIKQDLKTGENVTYSKATFKLEKLNEESGEWEKVKCKVGKDYYEKWSTDEYGIAYTETKLPYRHI